MFPTFLKYAIPLVCVMIAVFIPIITSVLWKIFESISSLNESIAVLVNEDKNIKSDLKDHEVRIRALEQS